MGLAKLPVARFAASPACVPNMEPEAALSLFRELGFVRGEVFTSWAQLHWDVATPFKDLVSRWQSFGIQPSSLHLPAIEAEGGNADEVERCMRMALDGGVTAQIFKAPDRESYIRWLPRFLNLAGRIGVTLLIQNHCKSPIQFPDDYVEIFDVVDDDRLKAVLEVGHFEKAGVPWREGSDCLQDRIGLVHIKDIKDGTSPPYGRGDVDFAALFDTVEQSGYTGYYVVEQEGTPDAVREAYTRPSCAWLFENFVEHQTPAVI